MLNQLSILALLTIDQWLRLAVRTRNCRLMSEKEGKDAKKSGTKSFVLRVDSETMTAIEAWAADEFRSTNGQLQWIINEALRKSGRLKKKQTH